jgi:hypothetical protein
LNAFQRFRGLILLKFDANCYLKASFDDVSGGADHHMKKPVSRRRRATTHRRISIRRAVHATYNGSKASRFSEELNVVSSINSADVRTDLVVRVRREIQEGVYDTPEKLEIALDRMFDNRYED